MMTRTGTRLTELLLTPKPLLEVELLLEDMLVVRATTDLGAHAGIAPPPRASCVEETRDVSKT
jgi:hypothetical protein